MFSKPTFAQPKAREINPMRETGNWLHGFDFSDVGPKALSWCRHCLVELHLCRSVGCAQRKTLLRLPMTPVSGDPDYEEHQWRPITWSPFHSHTWSLCGMVIWRHRWWPWANNEYLQQCHALRIVIYNCCYNYSWL